MLFTANSIIECDMTFIPPNIKFLQISRSLSTILVCDLLLIGSAIPLQINLDQLGHERSFDSNPRSFILLICMVDCSFKLLISYFHYLECGRDIFAWLISRQV